MSQLPLTVPFHLSTGVALVTRLKSMLWLPVSFTSVAVPAVPAGSVTVPSAKALNPAPPNEPYLIKGYWPSGRPLALKLTVTVDAGFKVPVTFINGAVKLPKVFGLNVRMAPLLRVNDDTFNEEPTLAASRFKTALLPTT